MAAMSLDGSEQPMDPRLAMAIEAAFRGICLTSVQFVSAPRAWHEINKRGSVSGPKGPRKAQIKMMLAKRHGARCAYCSREFVDLDDATLDHVIPNTIVRHWEPWNLLLACAPCNNLKSDKLPEVLMPLLCTLLRELLPLAQYKSTRGPSKNQRKKANRRARKQAANKKARVQQVIEAMAGAPVRLALEAPKPRLALPAGGE